MNIENYVGSCKIKAYIRHSLKVRTDEMEWNKDGLTILDVITKTKTYVTCSFDFLS